ncbi:hypothetical protein J2Y48_004760 [Mycoplana sp. BE70]|nr:hypothetical protein [Mycoplana sp. BE70]
MVRPEVFGSHPFPKLAGGSHLASIAANEVMHPLLRAAKSPVGGFGRPGKGQLFCGVYDYLAQRNFRSIYGDV